MQHHLQQPTLATLRAASILLGDSQGAWRAGGAGTQITSHLGITAFTVPATAIGPLSQILKKKREENVERRGMKGEERERK